MRSIAATGYGPVLPSLLAVVEADDAPGALHHGAHDERLLAVAQRHARLRMQRARGEHAHVRAHAPQRVDRLGPGDRAGRRVQAAADDVDGEARMVGQRHRDMRVGGDDRGLEVVGQAAGELERRRPAAERDRPRPARSARSPPGRRQPSRRCRRAGARRRSRVRASWAAGRPPWTRRSSPASDSSCRSRRTVSSDTRSRRARSEARTLPSAPSQRRMSSRALRRAAPAWC